MQTENKLNRYGVRRVAQEGRRVDCVCACGTPFSTAISNFYRVHGCDACCRAANQAKKAQWRRDHYVPHPRKGSQTKDEGKFAFEVLDPQAIWQRICERHRKRESDISQIAERRKSK